MSRIQLTHVEGRSAPTHRTLVPVQVGAAAAESVRSIEAPAAIPARKRRGLIEIELGDGKRVSVGENVDARASGRFFGMLASACRCTPSGWTAASSSGPRRLRARCRSQMAYMLEGIDWR